MATQVTLPKLGQTMEEGTIVEWMKAEGDVVSRGDVLYTLESDKAVLEVESRAKGTLLKILVGAGEKVPVGTPVAIIGQPNEDIADLAAGVVREPSLAEEAQPAAQTGVPQGAVDTTQPSGGAGESIFDELAEVTGEGSVGAEQALADVPPQEEIEEMARLFASPRARRLARERGVEIEALRDRGSGPEGRIVERDVEEYLAAQPAATPLARREAERLGVSLGAVQAEGPRVRQADVQAAARPAQPTAPVQPASERAAQPAAAAPATAGAREPLLGPAVGGTVQPLTGVRAIIAERMATSAHTTAPVTLHTVADATELVALREKVKDSLAGELGFSVGYNDLLAIIAARCLVEFPYMNTRLEAGGIRRLPEVHMGLAVDSERGLLVTVIRGADKMGIRELAKRFREQVARARDGKATPDELTGGTFTITNLGMFGVDAFTPIINLPECAILGVGRIRPEPAVVGDRVEVRQRMWLSLTFDHRLVDGAPAARFLQALVRYIEAPYLLLA